MKSRLATARLYGIVDLGYVQPTDLERITTEMCEGGVDILQLRAKGFDDIAIEEFANRIAPITAQAGIPFILNDHPELVPSVGADGAHVGQDDYTVDDARWRSGRSLDGNPPETIIGKSTHSHAQAIAATDADYIGFGPLFATPTKPGRPAIGLADIARVHAEVTIPIFCIGGIKQSNLRELIAAGARRVVIVSELLQASDIARYCREVRQLLDSEAPF